MEDVMVETIERDLTTPQGLHAEMQRLTSLIGTPGARANIYIVCWGKPYIGLQYGHDSQNTPITVVPADTFPEMIANAEQAIRNWRVTRHDSVIRKMALAIIELICDHTHCTETLLRGKGFSAADIAEYSEKTCARVGEMYAGAPFSVEMA